MTVREADEESSFQICTNHYRERRQPIECWRYSSLREEFLNLAVSQGASLLTLGKAWELLDSVALGSSTHHRVIFEPNRLLMHIALSVAVPATQCQFVTLNVAELTEGIAISSKSLHSPR